MNIEQKVKNILCELSSEDAIESDSLLQEDLALDSLALVTMLIDIEETFNIELDESDMNPFDLSTVNSVVEMISKYCGDENEETS